MNEDRVTIEVDGQQIETRKGGMLIDATDAAGIYIPRFCYHKKLTVAANCRMCLVEVERAPKPQPACATPCMDGMKVYTKSPKAISAQQATMEFLLINHPLDCPICDQGGECELQDLALGYGRDVSQYTEQKRVVRDKDIGPLVQTDMTRCIHCTRCVRFGDEIAGLRELGATGRGENMEIGTYVAHAMTSELSGNVIDLCPVGALTSRPYRYSARAWELQQHDSIAPHDCVGSNVHVHVKGQVVKRVVPKENEQVNETWLSDRDRFSYEALRSEQRLLTPRIKDQGQWQDCDWETALNRVQQGLAAIAGRGDGKRIGALASPSATSEEFFLLQRLVRGLGSQNVDYRLRQLDFSTQGAEPAFPSLNVSLAELEQADLVLLVGANPRHDQPLLNHRLRKAANRGARVIAINCVDYDFNFTLSVKAIVAPSQLVPTLAGVTKTLLERAGSATDTAANALAGLDPTAVATEIAAHFADAERPVVILGSFAQRHAERGLLLALAAALGRATQARIGQLTEGSNAAGAWLAGAIPHRGPGGRQQSEPGLNSREMLREPLAAYVLLGVEPARDCADPARALATLAQSELVVAITPFADPALEAVAQVLLPSAVFAENEGTYVNVCGLWQTSRATVKPPGEARPAWKILRMLGTGLTLPGFDALNIQDISKELQALSGDSKATRLGDIALDGVGHDRAAGAGLEAIVEVPLYAVDGMVRRAPALQQMPQRGDEYLHLSPATLSRLRLAAGAEVGMRADGRVTRLVTVEDERIPDGCCLIYGAMRNAVSIPATAAIEIETAN